MDLERGRWCHFVYFTVCLGPPILYFRAVLWKALLITNHCLRVSHSADDHLFLFFESLVFPHHYLEAALFHYGVCVLIRELHKDS